MIMARGYWFFTPKDIKRLSVHLTDAELNQKVVSYAKRVNTNISLVVSEIVRRHIDEMYEELDRSEYELMNEEAKIETILELKRKLKEAGIDA